MVGTKIHVQIDEKLEEVIIDRGKNGSIYQECVLDILFTI